MAIKINKMTALSIVLMAYMPTVKAQNIDSININKATRWEVGVNGTAFFKQFLTLNLSGSDSTKVTLETPYYIVAKFGLKKGIIRLGLGASLSSDNESNAKIADSKTVSNNDFQLRLGYEKQKMVSKRCDVYYGIDLLGGLSEKVISTNSSFDFITLTDRSLTLGIAPVAGLRFHLWPNVMLSTETSVRYRNISFSQTAEFSKNTDFNETGNKRSSNKIDFIAPTSIYVTVLF